MKRRRIRGENTSKSRCQSVTSERLLMHHESASDIPPELSRCNPISNFPKRYFVKRLPVKLAGVGRAAFAQERHINPHDATVALLFGVLYTRVVSSVEVLLPDVELLINGEKSSVPQHPQHPQCQWYGNCIVHIACSLLHNEW